MPGRAGVTLMELMVVLIIVGIAAAVSFPNYYRSVQTANAQAAKQNLLAIYSAQLNYFNGNGQAYCLSTAPTCGDNLFDLNSHLNLNISCSDSPCVGTSTDTGGYAYSCIAGPGTPPNPPFLCTATNSNANTQWTINDAAIALTGASPNPGCAGIAAGTNYCPP